jgi:hypothetical protein
MKRNDLHDRRDQALLALNQAIACMVAWPPSDEHLGGAIYFTALALHRMAQADPDERAAAWAKNYLAQARDDANHGRIAVPPVEKA